MVVGVQTSTKPNFAMTKCKQEVFEFQGHSGRKVTADFEAGYLSSDGGAVLLRGSGFEDGADGEIGGVFS